MYNYIDQNPAAAGLVNKPEQWQYKRAYHREHGIFSIVSLVTDTLGGQTLSFSSK
ncbi:MAG: hypothetical protein LBO67_03025 [Spirochaetaceae bacterium]|nr:hypothetical protein [Spirochaetaceae bacterium]